MHVIAIPVAKCLVLSATVSLGAVGLQARPGTVSLTKEDGFRVEVSYSDRALRTLTQRHETVMVMEILYGFPKPGTPRRLIAETGEVALGGNTTQEIQPGTVAVFNSLSVDSSALQYLNDGGPQLLINVFSGRKSSRDNLLDCSIYEGPLKQVQQETISIKCKLIAE